ncbi:MAG: 1-acyl-sn-glycerol-3-phosphate acyltransferase [Deltaproteobacteria bacterium]|nr:MAG: 1-acyl-sn-glycerol-3-phosphate acyltransferase [Deltaproteobacteria bacterium]
MIRKLLRFLIVHPYARWLSFRKQLLVHHPEVWEELSSPFILLANHAAFLDSIYLIRAVPQSFTICGARPKYFARWYWRVLMWLLQIIKVEHRKTYVEDCQRLLQENKPLLIYPEMKRNKEAMGPFKTWAAEVALANHVPVIPAYIYGTTQGQEGPIQIVFGQPYLPDASLDPESLTQDFRSKIQSLADSIHKPHSKGASSV